jgi:arsenate reductase
MANSYYHNPSCGTSRRVKAMLDDAGRRYSTILYLKEPPGKVALRDLLSRMVDPPADLVRKDKRFAELGLDENDYTTKQAVVDLLAEHPELMQRPIIDTGRRAFLARPPARAQAWLEGKAIG